MEPISVIAGTTEIPWKCIVLVLSVLAAFFLSYSLYATQKGGRIGMWIFAPFATMFSLFFCRMLYWYCNREQYNDFTAAMRDVSPDGFAMLGILPGVLLAAALVRLVRLNKSLPAMLDALAPAAALGIAVGRLSDYFSSSDRAKFFLEESLQRIPFSAPTVNATSGATEWRLATFFAQSAWCTLLFVFLTIRLLLRFRRKPVREKWRTGRVFELFMLLYCLGQIVFDSTRYDALFLRSNGFVSLEQIVCGVVVVAILALYSVRSILVNRFRFWHPLLWAGALAGLGLAGFMEYYVQRHGDLFLFCYSIMSVGLFIFFCMTLILYWTTTRRETKQTPGPEVRRDEVPAEPAETEDDGFPAEDMDREKITV